MDNLSYISVGLIFGFLLGIITAQLYVRCKYGALLGFAKAHAAKKKEQDDWKAR